MTILGRTGTGKSRLARALAESIRRHTGDRARQVILDPVGATMCELPGAVTVRRPVLLDKALEQSAVVRLVPVDPYDLNVWGEAYRWAWDRGPSHVWCDEAGFILPARGAPRSGLRFLTQGRKFQMGHLACHTRPRDIARDLIAQAEHLAVFDLPNPDDVAHVADVFGMRRLELDDAIRALGPFEFLWCTQGQPLRHCGALPPP